MHYRFCPNACASREEEAHYGGDGSCSPICEVCGEEYYDENGEHRNVGSWGRKSDTQHYRYCEDCWQYREVGDCTGGNGSCISTCEICGGMYKKPDGQHYYMTAWAYESETQHSRYCRYCGTEEYGEHILSDWTLVGNTQHTRRCTLCNDSATAQWQNHYSDDVSCKPTCDGCHTAYVNLQGEHGAMSEWQKFDETRHYRCCTMCDIYTSRVYEDHIDSNSDGECDVCSAEMPCTHANMSEWFSVGNTQHHSYCMDCEDYEVYEAHNGGEATCTAKAVCLACDAEYGGLDPDNHDWHDWVFETDTKHYRYCWDCRASEYEDHSGYAATCTEKAYCTTCYEEYGELDPDNHDMSGWEPYNDTQHIRGCFDCRVEVYEDHIGGEATCDSFAECEVCGAEYGELAPDKHGWCDWEPYNDTQHVSVCWDCGEIVVYEDHTGSDGTCMPCCDVCESDYYDATGTHDMSGWDPDPYDDTQHVSVCLDCGKYKEYGTHHSEWIKCNILAKCDDCGASFDAANGTHPNMSDWMVAPGTQHRRVCVDCGVYEEYGDHTGRDGTCYPTCEVCEYPYYDATGTHDMSDWMWISETQHARGCYVCMEEDAIEFRDHTGGEATCKAQAVCTECNTAYGELNPDKHANATSVSPIDDNRHMFICGDCRAWVYEAHYGGDDTCKPVCDLCGYKYTNPNGRHDGMRAWSYLNTSTHRRWCEACSGSETYESEAHSGGDGSCLPICEDCGGEYIDNNGKHGNTTDWAWENDQQHSCYCNACFRWVYADHTGGEATCAAKAECEVCGEEYGELSTEHNDMSEWTNYSETQHYRFCWDCTTKEYADHTGGEATCAAKAECEVCGAGYGERSNEHSWGEWEWLNYGNHLRKCGVCTVVEEAPHSGGDGSCLPTCEVCGEMYLDGNGQHRNMSEWCHYGDTQHYRYCNDCGRDDSYEYADHTGGEATCYLRAKCEVCGSYYGELSNDHNNMSEWFAYGDTQHYRYCNDCDRDDSIEYASHSGGDGSCVPNCEFCGAEYSDGNGQHRNISKWFHYSDTQHLRYCSDCGTEEYEDHSGGDGSCRPVCRVCEEEYYNENGTHSSMSDWIPATDTQHLRYCEVCLRYEEFKDHTGGEATCILQAICTECSLSYGDVDPNNHVMSDWYHYSYTQHWRYCWQCMDTATYEYEAHDGGTATCDSLAECEDCGMEYGEYDSDNHKLSDWEVYTPDYHYRYCERCYDDSTCEYVAHYGGDGSCWPYCDVCGWRYVDPNGRHDGITDWRYVDQNKHWRQCEDCGNLDAREFEDHYGGIDGTCSPVCEGCGESYYDPNGQHGAMSGWEAIDDDQHIRVCLDCRTIEYEAHTSDKASCVAYAACDVCGHEYISADSHSWGEWKSNGNGTHTRVCQNDASHTESDDCTGGKATCTEDGVCEVCDGAYIPAIQHSWGEWRSNGDGTHTRICANDATHTETEDCTGGKATCVTKATCTVCGDEYGALATDHSWGEWKSNNDGTHTRICANDATHTETEDCIGGKATCTEKAVCTVCDSKYGDVLGHAYGEWKSNGNGTHTRVCANDAKHIESDDCTGGKATCTEDGVCEVCDGAYIPAISHAYGEWKSNGNGTHTRVCANDATHTETDDCTGGKATCTEDGVCVICGGAYIPAISHAYGEWKSNGDGTHTRVCQNDATHAETDDCTGGKATCTDKAECETCAAPYGDVLGHIPGTEADCTHDQVCTREGCGAVLAEKLGHIHGAEADCTNDQVCTREGCGAVLAEKLGHIPGAEADCTNDQVCTREGCGAVLAEKLGHDYTAVVTKPTCTEPGYTTYTCSRCEDSYQADQTAARGHWYDLWYPNGDGTHSADCKRYGCSHEGTTECTLYEVTVKDGETETILTVCPVCGDHERATFGVVSGAAIKNVYINHPLPCGEQIVRELDAPFDGVLYAFTVAYESAGRVVPFNGKVSVSLPLDAEKYAGFKLVRVDVTPATETNERTEVWTEVAFTFENGKLTFETDVAGLFLLIPIE